MASSMAIFMYFCTATCMLSAVKWTVVLLEKKARIMIEEGSVGSFLIWKLMLMSESSKALKSWGA